MNNENKSKVKLLFDFGKTTKTTDDLQIVSRFCCIVSRFQLGNGFLLRRPLFWSHASVGLEGAVERGLIGKTRLQSYRGNLCFG